MGTFWRFGLAPENTLESLLQGWDPSAPSPTLSPVVNGSQNGIDDASTSSIASGEASTSKTPNTLTLEQLLDEEELLQECKSGHAKLTEFLSSPYAVKRMLQYVSGEAFGPLPVISPQDIPPPLPPKDTSATGSASITIPSLSPREGSPADRELLRKRLKYPFICTEILCMDQWRITETIFGEPETYLVPFWNEILDKSPKELAQIAVQVGHWAKVNILWLSNSHVPQMLRFLQSLPDLFPRLLTHLASVSSISDIILKLVSIDDQHPELRIVDWLSEVQLVDRVLVLLDPRNNDLEAHGPAGDLLRGIVAAASAASASKQQQQQQQQQQQGAFSGEINSETLGLNGTGPEDSAWSNWPNNALVRQLASRRTVERLLEYMLDVRPLRTGAPLSQEDAQTPTPKSPALAPAQKDPAELLIETPPTPTLSNPRPTVASIASTTSSVLTCLTLLIDIIRKNNSDFTELQILQYLQRLPDEDEVFSSDDSDSEDAGSERHTTSKAMEQGPSLVDLGPLLECVTRRLPDIHYLLLHPRSNINPSLSSLQHAEMQEPLTFERYKICELYAELLHCSNMAILNRQPVPPISSSTSTATIVPCPAYDRETGRVMGTRRQALQSLSLALTPQTNENQLTGNAGEGANLDIDDEGMVEDISLVEDDDADDLRPVTAQSDVTSSYTSGDADGPNGGENSEDVLDFLNSATEDFSLEEDSQPNLAPGGSFNMSSSDGPGSHRDEAGFLLSASVTQQSDSNDAAHPAINVDTAESQIREGVTLPGPALKRAFIDLKVVPACLNLFFRFPWNNFLHGVVYDLLQQIFNGKLEVGLNRELCLATFTQGGGLVNMILQAADENNAAVNQPRGVRLGYMGHLTLISEEIVKLFYNNQREILAKLPEDAFDRVTWERYVEGSFRETRETDLQPLGGGITMAMYASASAGSGGGGAGIVDLDDEFPSQGKNLFSAEGEASSGDTSPDKAHFARYLASQIATDFDRARGDNLTSSSSGSSSSDSSSEGSPEDAQRFSGTALRTAAANWFGGNEGDSAFDDYDDEDEGPARTRSTSRDAFESSRSHSAGVVGRKLATHAGSEQHDRLGFDDRFSSFESPGFTPNDGEEDDDDAFGPFSDSYAAEISPQPGTSRGFTFDDDFVSSGSAAVKVQTVTRENLTPADWNSSFRSSYQASFGEFGDFASAESPVLSPNGDFNDDDDDDFGDFETGGSKDHGDYDFSLAEGDLVIGTEAEESPKSPSSTSGTVLSPGEEIHGPGIHEGAHISLDGTKVEAEVVVDGETVTVQVPKDELALHPDIIDKPE